MARAIAAIAAAANISARGRGTSFTFGRFLPWTPKKSPKFAFNILPRDFTVSFTSLNEKSRTYADCSRVTASDEAAPEKSKDYTTGESIGKSQNSEPLKLNCAAAMLPHPDKAAKGGEDAFFTEGPWIGVSDGVGGWATEGVDSGAYSRELMSNCKALVTNITDKPNPKEVLVNAARLTKARGSATALVAVLHDQKLHIANAGDSGILVIRDWHVIFESKPMQHDFNFPFQIGTMGDDPRDALGYTTEVSKGDIIVLGTDGLFDNLFQRDIVQILKDTLGKGLSVQEAAARLAARAQIAGKSSEASPFSEAAKASRLSWFKGGKLDDVTTVVAVVA